MFYSSLSWVWSIVLVGAKGIYLYFFPYSIYGESSAGKRYGLLLTVEDPDLSRGVMVTIMASPHSASCVWFAGTTAPSTLTTRKKQGPQTLCQDCESGASVGGRSPPLSVEFLSCNLQEAQQIELLSLRME